MTRIKKSDFHMPSSSEPLVSIVVPVYNGGRYFASSIESLLGQTYSNIEIVIVDDGSTDGYIEDVKKNEDPRIRFFSQEHAGRSRALNYALAEIKGEYYATHDADDISYPTRIERQVSFLQGNRELAGVFCGNDLILNDEIVAPRFRTKAASECRENIQSLFMPAHDTTAMYRVELVKDIQYEEALPFVEAYDYILRVGEVHPLMVIGECLYSYRIHYQSITRCDPRKRMEHVRKVHEKALTRRGASGAFNDKAGIVTKRLTNSDRDNNIAAYFMDSVCDLRREGRRREALLNGIRCSRLHFFDFHYHKALVYAIIPRWLIRKIRRDGHPWGPGHETALYSKIQSYSSLC